MTLGDLTDRGAVLRAVQHYDELGADQFLRTYGFGPARDYLLQVDGKHYDSKAIAGVAYGLQHPDRGTLPPGHFSGSAKGAAQRLEKLGFTIVTPAQLTPPRIGEQHANRTAIRATYGGNGVAGIIQFPGEDVVNAFSDEEGPYADEPPDPVASFEYRGEGRQGDQTLVRGNKMLDTARQERRAVRYWYRPAGGTFSFVTWIAVLDRAQVWAPDDKKKLRLEYTFLVAAVPDPDPETWPKYVVDRVDDRPITDAPPPPAPTSTDPDKPRRARSYREYVDRLGEKPALDSTQLPKKALRNNYQRSRQAREAVLIRAGNCCENDRCTGMPEDTTPTGAAILEVDHVDDIAFGGSDHPTYMIALCPNCHAAKTRGKHRATLQRRLRSRAVVLHNAALDRARRAGPSK